MSEHTVSLCKDCPDEETKMNDQVQEAVDTVDVSGHERPKWIMDWRVDKYDGEVTQEMIAAGLKPVEVVNIEGNLLTTAGIARLLDLLIGAGGQALNNANSRIGVGNSSTAAAVGDTDLAAAAGAGNRQFVEADATFPSRSGTTVTWVATFTTGLANFNWLEFGIDAGTANGTTVVAPLLNRKVISAGTKTSAQTWVATATLTIA